MIQTLIKNSMRAMRVSMLGMALVSTVPCTGQALPRTQPGEDDAKLDAKVSFSVESGSVGQVAAELSKQTGISIAAASSIRDRKLTFEAAGITVRQALDALAETYDCRWYRRQPGQYVVDRMLFRTPTDSTAIPALMQAALPVDIRIFAALPDLKSKKPDERTSDMAVNKIGQTPWRAIYRFRSSLTGVFTKQDALEMRDLSPLQRDDLVTWMVFASFRNTMELLHDDYAPHKMDMKQLTLHIEQASMLMIKTTPDAKPGFGFGTQIFDADGRPVP